MRDLSEQLLQASGQVVHLDDEKLMDAVTALSGSGPAYVFLLAEAMAAAGHKLGLPEDMSMQLAIQTIKGVGLPMADASPPARLRENVTFKGGTTAAALAVLMQEGRMAALLDEALAAAARRQQSRGMVIQRRC